MKIIDFMHDEELWHDPEAVLQKEEREIKA